MGDFSNWQNSDIFLIFSETLRKHTYSNLLKILPPNIENYQIKNSDILHISAQNIDCGYLLELFSARQF